MRARSIAGLAVLLCAVVTVLLNAESVRRRWAMYEHEMQNPAEDPPDAWEKTEFAFARLRFRSNRDGHYRSRWGTDANKSERQLIQGVRRLTRIHARSVEQIVDIESDEIDWPWLYAVGVGDWTLSESHVERLRNYFERGGTLMVDDFHGEREWTNFAAGIARILPDYPIVELEDDSPIFRVVYELKDRYHVPGLQILYGQPWERNGVGHHWRGVLDHKGRVLVTICFNMDLGDAWEWADHPAYPERYPALAYRIGINYLIYAMTH
jgi:hypothetical protein